GNWPRWTPAADDSTTTCAVSCCSAINAAEPRGAMLPSGTPTTPTPQPAAAPPPPATPTACPQTATTSTKPPAGTPTPAAQPQATPCPSPPPPDTPTPATHPRYPSRTRAPTRNRIRMRVCQPPEADLRCS